MKLNLINGKRVTKGNELELISIGIENGIITEIGTLSDADQTIDLQGKLLTPGLVDVHLHLREPGFTDKETIKTGSMAAARGGVTTICAMPNTNPVPDTKVIYDDIVGIINRDAVVNTYQYAPITMGLRSDELVDMEAINAFAYTNDGVGVQTAGTMYLAMKEAARLNKPIVAHTEDDSLLFGGVMHEGRKNKELGLPGIMGIAESSQIARDILLAKETGVHYHVCHVSSKESVSAIRWGKSMGVNVTAEVAPHHLILCEDDITENDSKFKMNPPLRSKEDREALIEGVLDGTIEIIATDHAPHTKEDKAGGFMGTPFGIVGIETSFALIYTHFVRTGIFTLEEAVKYMSSAPAELFNLPGSSLELGSVADLVVFDLELEEAIDPSEYLSKSDNTMFNGEKVYGMCDLCLVNGEIVWRKEA